MEIRPIAWGLKYMNGTYVGLFGAPGYTEACTGTASAAMPNIHHPQLPDPDRSRPLFRDGLHTTFIRGTLSGPFLWLLLVTAAPKGVPYR